MFDSSGKVLDTFDSDWTNLTGYGGANVKHFGEGVMKGIWNNTKWKFIFHILDAKVSVLIGLRILRQIGIFNKPPIVYTETVDHCSSQLKEGKNSQNQDELPGSYS